MTTYDCPARAGIWMCHELRALISPLSIMSGFDDVARGLLLSLTKGQSRITFHLNLSMRDDFSQHTTHRDLPAARDGHGLYCIRFR